MTTITNAAKTETANENLKFEVLWIFNKGFIGHSGNGVERMCRPLQPTEKV